MGCSAAKNLAVEPLNGTEEGGGDGSADQNGDVERKVSITRRASEVPPLESDEPHAEMLEEGTMNNVQKTPNGLSFDIAFEEEGSESIIRKHPPKRFQKLEEQEQTSPNLSLDKLQQKLDEAEIRRQQILQQRVASAKVRNALRRQKRQEGEEGDDDGDVSDEKDPDDEATEEDPNHLKVPPDIPA